MTALDRKLLRDSGTMRGQAVAIALVVACGVATFVMTRSRPIARFSRRATPTTGGTASPTCSLVSSARRNALLERDCGDSRRRRVADARVVADVTLDVPGLAEPATGRLVSVPEGARPRAQRAVILRAAGCSSRRARDEVVASEAFATRQPTLKPGDRVGARHQRPLDDLRIVGVALSPEYVYGIRPRRLIFPDNQRFGVFWMSRRALGPRSTWKGGFNDVVLRSAPRRRPGATSSRALDRSARAATAGSARYGREDQLSDHVLDDELAAAADAWTLVPAIFLGVAAFLLNVVAHAPASSTQREQIAAPQGARLLEPGDRPALPRVRARHRRHRRGARHRPSALWLGSGLTGALQRVLPLSVPRLPSVGFGAGCRRRVGSLGAGGARRGRRVNRAVRLPPAEAMRPEAPARYRASFFERLRPARLLSPAARMVVRNLDRRPIRFALSVLGVSLAVGILVLGRYFWDMVDEAMDLQFFRSSARRRR